MSEQSLQQSRLSNKIEVFFVWTASVILILTASGKIASFFYGKSLVLSKTDPLIGLPFRDILLLAAVLELGLVFIVIIINSSIIRSISILWFVFMIIFYRLGWNIIDYPLPCNCLGSFTDALHLSNAQSSLIAKCILFYLSVGSIYMLLVAWRKSRIAQF